MKQKFLDVIYVNYNSSELVENSLNSLFKVRTGLGLNAFIIDNSGNYVRDYEDNCGLNIKVLQPGSNQGFSKANNLAVSKCESEYFCFLNPDTIVVQDFFSPIIRFIESNPQAGACAPKLVYSDGSYQNSSGSKMGLWYEFFEATMLIALVRRVQRKRIESLAESGEPLKVGWVSAACMIVRRTVFEKAGGFSEEFFLNYEDIDLCRKLEDSGFQNYLFTNLQCVHLDHKSFDSNFELLVYSRYESRLIYAKRHYSDLSSLFVRLIHIIGIFARIIPTLIVYRANERNGRLKGYLKSINLYLGLKNRN